MNPVYCVNCRKLIDVSDVFCKHCGHTQNKAARPSVNPTFSTPNVGTQTVCPVCRCCTVHKVSGIVHAGAWSANTAGQFAGALNGNNGNYSTFGGVTSSSTAGATNLARMLAPPPKPGANVPVSAFASICFGGAALICRIFHSSTPDPRLATAIVALLIIAVLLVPIAIWEGFRLRSEYHELVQNWQRSIITWNRLYYCSGCDLAFDPHTSNSAASCAISALIG